MVGTPKSAIAMESFGMTLKDHANGWLLEWVAAVRFLTLLG